MISMIDCFSSHLERSWIECFADIWMQKLFLTRAFGIWFAMEFQIISSESIISLSHNSPPNRSRNILHGSWEGNSLWNVIWCFFAFSFNHAPWMNYSAIFLSYLLAILSRGWIIYGSFSSHEKDLRAQSAFSVCFRFCLISTTFAESLKLAQQSFFHRQEKNWLNSMIRMMSRLSGEIPLAFIGEYFFIASLRNS